MVATDKTLTAVPVPANSQTNLYFITGNTDASFDIITGYGGYITIPDAAALEPAAEFAFEFTDTWLDTSVDASKYLLHKTEAVEIYTGVVNEEVTATIYAAATNETLLPSGVGNATNLGLFGAPTNWQAAASDDDDTSYVSNAGAELIDTYACQDSSNHDGGPINSVTVYAKCRAVAPADFPKFHNVVRTTGVTHLGAEKSTSGQVYDTSSMEWALNPETGLAWTWDEIDAMEIGVALEGAVDAIYCTYVHAVVNYDPQYDVTATGVVSGEHDVEVGIELR